VTHGTEAESVLSRQKRLRERMETVPALDPTTPALRAAGLIVRTNPRRRPLSVVMFATDCAC